MNIEPEVLFSGHTAATWLKEIESRIAAVMEEQLLLDDFVRFRSYVPVKTRRKRMRKKVSRSLGRYLTAAGRAKYTAFVINLYLRRQINEDSFARRIFIMDSPVEEQT
jgi:hypothetical protein